MLEVLSDNSEIMWTHDATASRIAAAAAAGEAYLISTPTVHTEPISLELDPSYLHSEDDNNGADARDDGSGSEEFFDMTESLASSEDDLGIVEEPVEAGELISARLRPPHTEPRIAASSPETSTPVQAQSLISEMLDAGSPFNRDLPPTFSDLALPQTATPDPSIPTSSVSSQHHAVPDDSDTDEEIHPPEYQLIDTNVHPLTDSGLSRDDIATIDPSELHLIHQRVTLIKRTCQPILAHIYGAESCPHPPLFVLLPDNPLHWSQDNILQNKMRLHFLCSCCEHEETQQTRQSPARRRNVHVHESKGFEIRLDQFQDQMLLIKFGHYILNLLRMLRYGISLDGVFVSAAFDRPASSISNKPGADLHLFLNLKQNVGRSIEYTEALLGDEYDDEAMEAVSSLDMNDFRLLDWIVKRPSYAQPSSAEPASPTNSQSSSSFSNSAATDMVRDLAVSDIHVGGSGLYKVLGSDSQVRWGCEKFYDAHHENLDKVFANKLELMQTTFDHQTRSAVWTATAENQLNARIIMASKIKALFRVDITLDWDYGKLQLDTLAQTLKWEATTVSTLALRLSKRVPPLAWKKNLPTQGEDQQPINAIINLIKNRKIKHLILEGDIDLMSIPNIGTMDFTNLDILSITKTTNRGYNYNNNVASSDCSVHSNDNTETAGVANHQVSRSGLTQDEYIPELISFLPSCSDLTELCLGFSDAIPGHVRILQACITGLANLKRLDLFRVLGNRSFSGSSIKESKSGTTINRKLELSASISASKVTRLYMAECKATGESKAKLLESLEELLMDEGSHLEDLELYFVGFSDKHAHALEVGTVPTLGDYCRLRRLVIHGNGLGYGGVAALKQVIRRATKSDRRTENGDNPTDGSSSGTPMAPTVTEAPESVSFGTMRERTTLMHLELRSMDSLTDSDWADLLSESNLQHLITLDLQGVGFGDRAMRALARTGHTEDSDSTSPPHSPSSESSSSASMPPPAFFSSSAPLQLQTLRLNSSALSHKGVVYMQEFLSRLTHLSTLSLHGFRRVTSGHWVEILARISFRWIEMLDIVSLGVDDECSRYLGERIKTREQALSSLSEADLPTYYARPSVDSTMSAITTSSASTTSSSASPSSPRAVRRESFSSRLFNTTMQRRRNTDLVGDIPESPTTAAPLTLRRNPTYKYLEIDLRYTDVSAKALSVLRADMIDQAKKVVIHTRDGEEEEDEDRKELERLKAKLNDHKESEDRPKRNGKDRITGTYVGTYGGAGISPAAIMIPSGTTPYRGSGGGNVRGNGSNTNNGSVQQAPQPSKSSTFLKLKNAFKKN